MKSPRKWPSNWFLCSLFFAVKLSIADESTLIKPVLPDSVPIAVYDLVEGKDYRGTLYTNVDPMDRESRSGRRLYVTPVIGFEKAVGRQPLQLPGMDGEALATAISRARLDVKDALFETDEGGWARVRSSELQAVVRESRVDLYLAVTVTELKKANRPAVTTTERVMRIPFQDIADRVHRADDHFRSDAPWEDDRYYLPTEDEQLIPVKIVGHTQTNVWVVLDSEFGNPKATQMHILRVSPNLLRRLPRVEINRLRPSEFGKYPVGWYRTFYAGEDFTVPALERLGGLKTRYEILWKAVHERAGVIPLPYLTVNCAAQVASGA